MFFWCKNCKKVWQYKIEKCPRCFLPLERIKSKKAKVIEVAKVQIPSIFHSKVPYFVLVLEDENGNKWLQKSIKEYKVGEEIEFERERNKKAVAIWRVKYDLLEAIEKVVEMLGGIKISQSSKILILPTLVSVSHPYFRDNTSPQFLKAVLKFLFEFGIKPENIKIASQSFDEIAIGPKAQKSKLLKVCQDFKILPLDLAETNFVKRGDLEISEEALKVDLILNLPILKMEKAQATENLFVLLKKENFLAQKYLTSEKEIFKKLRKETPEYLTIAEANYIQDKTGFVHHLNLVLSSFSPQNLDYVFLKITKKEIPEILKEVKIEEIPIFGRKIEEVALW
jgi:uncharacterized OB-fold protein